MFFIATCFLISIPGQEWKVDDTLVRESGRFPPGIYQIEDSNHNGAVQIRGDNLVLDFQGVTLSGAKPGTAADQFRGFGIYAENCKKLTVKNLRVQGYQIGMYFKNCDDLSLVNCDVSGNFRQHLKSTPKAEDLSDWLFGHENDKNEWFRYGAGVYIESSSRVQVSRCRARGGQNGLCLSKVNDSWIFDNDMSFLSGWGLAMWRSSRNEVSNNKFDWCMRGFSYGVYHRGQDSAGILVYEQCHDNIFAYNSATHGGDGFFLYAGNETLERTGEGGCNRNILYRNDFSHAAANGIEATFSEGNQFIENILEECDHGIWAGYSYNTKIVGNQIRNNNHGISIEHGRGNHIEANHFENNATAIQLWANPNPEFQKKAFGKKRDISSAGYAILKNHFQGGKIAVSLRDTSDVVLHENKMDVPLALRILGKHSGIRTGLFEGKIEGPAPEKRIELGWPVFSFSAPKTRGTMDAYLAKDALRGRKYIFVDDWGPYDFSAPRLFPEKSISWESAEFYLLGPGGAFRIENEKGQVLIRKETDRIPAKIQVLPQAAGYQPFSFSVRVGEHLMAVEGALLQSEWDVRFFRWEKDPREFPEQWKQLLDSDPLIQRKLLSIDFVWAGSGPGQPAPMDRFGTLATTEMELPEGEYEFRTVSDDGIRVWVDEKLVLDNWTWHGPTEDKARIQLQAGTHRIRIEHFEIDGFAQLQFFLEML